MINKPMDVLHAYPVRRGRRKKQFRSAVADYLKNLGYACKEEKGSLGSRNIIAGDPEKAKYLVTAHYDTCAGMLIPNLITPRNVFLFLLYQFLVAALLMIPTAAIGISVGYFLENVKLGYLVWYALLILTLVLMYAGPANRHNANDNTSGVVTLLEIAATMPEKYRERVCFVLFDLEEAGLVGSSSYRSAHKQETNRQIVLNLDCVGDGDRIWFFPNRKLRKDAEKLSCLEACSGTWGRKSITVHKNGFSVYPSDQRNFPYGVGICALHKGKLGLYMGRIHTRRDTVLEETNVNILRACLVSLITCAAVEEKGNEL